MIALVDCNNFFCSCERVFNPALQGRPLVVLSNNDGCIISRSEEAKVLGIPMGAPLHEQQEVIRKHDVQVFSSNYTLYGDMSARVMSILREEVPAIEVYSIDEAFLSLPENFEEVMARSLRAKVLQWTGIPVCIGIGSTKLLAKLANRHAKKNKALTGGIFDFDRYRDPDGIMASTPTDGLWGVGKNLALRLKGMGITTALEFKQADPASIRKSMGVIGERMMRELNGIPCLELEEMPPEKKGVMASRSFGSPVESLEELEEALANHVSRAAEKIRRYGLLATRMEVFLRTGVQLASLVSEEEYQPELFDHPKARINVDRIVDEINRRLGDPKNPVITRASQGTIQSGKGWRMRSERHSPHYTTDWNQLPVVRSGS